MDIKSLITEVNIAEKLDDKKLQEVGDQVVRGYEADEKTRSEWKQNIEEWTNMALQISDKKTFPWTNASNVKFPLLSTAAMQFAARAYPTLVPSDGKIVKCKVIGSDPDGQKTARALRVSKHMSYQIIDEMEEWEEDMDRLLVILPIVGTVFKKTYFDSELGRNKSCLVMPKNLVVNYWTRNLDECERATEYHEYSKRQVQEKINKGLYLDADLSKPTLGSQEKSKSDPNAMLQPEEDETTPYVILEQHSFLDLDDDGYPEPYVIIVEKDSKKVLRIAARFSEDDVEVGEKGDVVAIKPNSYYTKYSFFPNPDGGFYDVGFGRLLGPINASVDTLINQLIDAGSLSNLQAGFIAKGLRVKMGDSKFQPGEWKAVNATGQDLKQQIFPLPVREPSAVLFKLLELLAQSSKELASVAEIFVGKMPGQNTPATTTMASIEQGMKLFTAVYKRVYRSLGKEFQKLYKLNRIYLDPQVELDIVDEPIQQSDYLGNEKDITPAADPAAASQQERLQKAQSMLQLIQLGTINPMEVTKRLLEAMEIPNPEQLMQQPQPKPDPKQQEMEMKAGLEQQKLQATQQMNQQKMQMEQSGKEHEMQIKAAMAQQAMAAKEQEAATKARIAASQAGIDMRVAQAEHGMKMQQQSDNHRQSLIQNAMNHQQSMAQQSQASKAKAKEARKKPTK